MNSKKHDLCKYFGHTDCPAIENKTMKSALVDTSQFIAGTFKVMTKTPTPQEVDALCSECQQFNPA
ncbi:MAG: hypothetical protein HGA96_01600 [Desulfobulbaceae bacterium]|nr:hypothetical protein [Desulfobulbaceae bacterium]